jgi:argininosuccinate lyase
MGLETGRELNHLKLEELRTLSDAFADDFFDAITLEATLDCHDVVGGTARARVASAVAAAKARLGENN